MPSQARLDGQGRHRETRRRRAGGTVCAAGYYRMRDAEQAVHQSAYDQACSTTTVNPTSCAIKKAGRSRSMACGRWCSAPSGIPTYGQLRLGFAEIDDGRELWEYAVLVTSLDPVPRPAPIVT